VVAAGAWHRPPAPAPTARAPPVAAIASAVAAANYTGSMRVGTIAADFNGRARKTA